MSGSFRARLINAVASPRPEVPAPLRPAARGCVAGAAIAAGMWVFIFKLQCFWGLETTSDMYAQVQQTTSWLEGRFYYDNCFGNILWMHTYFLSPLLAVFTVPFGAVGLFITLGLAVAAQIVALVKIQRLLRVPVAVALGYGLVSTVMPLAMHMYQDSIYGYHLELLLPALALWLAYFLLNRQWRGVWALTVTLILFKEDAPLLVMVVAAMVLAEDFIRPLGHGGRPGWNRPAAVSLLLAAVSVPVLLYFMKTQQVEGQVTNLSRLHVAGSAGITNLGTLFSYVFGNLGTWLKSPIVAGWLALALPATFGLIVLRPHLLAAGVLTTAVAWLVQQELLWPPRVAPALAFFQLAGGLALASVCQLLRDCPMQRWRGRVAGGLIVGLLVGGVAWGLWKQGRMVPRTGEVYRLEPALAFTPEELALADGLFATYRRESKKAEPVIASPFLFRYAHDRNLFWYDRLANKPRPEWILWDRQEQPLSLLWLTLKGVQGSESHEYRLVDRAGRFLLFKRKSEAELAPPLPAAAAIAGESAGAIRLRVKFPAMFASLTEPLLAIGAPGRGELFFVRYFDDERLALGWEDRGGTVYMGEPIAYEPGRAYELELFCGSLLAENPGAERLPLQDLVHISWDGRELVNSRARSNRTAPPLEIQPGRNAVQSADVRPVFTGEIIEARRGGYPVPAPTAGVTSAWGAVRLAVDLPETMTGAREPLVVAGVSGEATLGYIKLLPGGLAQVGVEFWGTGASESEPFPLAHPGPAEVIFHLPVLYPPEGDWRWGDLPPAQQQALRSRCKVVVNGVVRLDAMVTGAVPRRAAVFYATNPAGGNWVSAQFTGVVRETSRLPLARP
jgi:hypothetical protein